MEHVWEENGGTDRDHPSHRMTEYEQRDSGVFPGHHLKLRWRVHGRGLLVPNRRHLVRGRRPKQTFSCFEFSALSKKYTQRKNPHNA